MRKERNSPYLENEDETPVPIFHTCQSPCVKFSARFHLVLSQEMLAKKISCWKMFY